MINGIVLGVRDVSDGSSQIALDTLKAELRKLGQSVSAISHIVSSTYDGTSSQLNSITYLRRRVENHKKLLLKSKCAMHA